ncbi:hypothetical protein F5B21DRAFT_453314 [Xylaria acuta]|nr:hypothetical protein F5B21DRAFT_453314 [Xylaria acuta]
MYIRVRGVCFCMVCLGSRWEWALGDIVSRRRPTPTPNKVGTYLLQHGTGFDLTRRTAGSINRTKRCFYAYTRASL